MTATATFPLDTLQRRELAEGVEVELRPAGPMVRAAAYALDFLWQLLILLGIGLIFMLVRAVAGYEVGEGTSMLLTFVANWGYHVYFEAGPRAATPGKRTMKLRVVSETGGPASLSAVMLRNIARTADMMPIGYLTGLLVCLFTRRFQRLGDIVARTLVVYANADTLTPPKSPPPLPGRKPHPPRVTLTREERRAVVRYDERAPLWSPARREELAGHASALTQANGMQGVQELALIASWLRDS
jgi:uncharacterized RDD family membrane protein YckC